MKFDVIIEKGSKKYYATLTDKSLTGFFLEDGYKKTLDDEFFDLLSVFKLSKNNKLIKSTKKYDEFLDLDTGFHHYIKDGEELLALFIKNNSSNALQYAKRDEKGNKKSFKNKLLSFKLRDKALNTIAISITIVCLVLAVDTAINVKTLFGLKEEQKRIEEQSKYTLVADEDFCFETYQDEFEHLGLPIEESRCLFNFLKNYWFTDRSTMNVLHNFNLKDCEIVIFPYESDNTACGYYSIATPNKIYICEDSINDDVKVHESLHLLSDYKYNILGEGMGQILKYEYYGIPVSSNIEEVVIVKQLLELLGPDGLMLLYATGNSSLLVSELSQYLTDEQILEFFNHFSYATSLSIEKTSFDKLDEERTANIEYISGVIKDITLKKMHHPYEEDLTMQYLEKYDSRRSVYTSKRYFNEPNSVIFPEVYVGKQDFSTAPDEENDVRYLYYTDDENTLIKVHFDDSLYGIPLPAYNYSHDELDEYYRQIERPYPKTYKGKEI